MIQTSLAGTLDNSDYEAKYDNNAKCILAEKGMLAYILAHTMKEFVGIPPEKIIPLIEGEPTVILDSEDTNDNMCIPPKINGMNTVLTEPGAGKIEQDIRFSVYTPWNFLSPVKQFKIIINIELQNRFNPGYSIPKRQTFYSGRMISIQQGTEFTNSDYDSLKQVVSIWIFTEPSEADQLTLSVIHNSQHNIIGTPTDRSNEYENNRIINICLSKDMDKCVHFGSDIHRFLGTVFSETIPVEMKKEILQNDFHIPMNEEIDRRLMAMHNGFSQGIKRKAIEEGRREGVATVIKVLLSKGYGTDFIINLGYTQDDIDMAINLNDDISDENN